MTWIDIVRPDEATGELKQQYEDQFAKLGFHSNFYQALSLKPDALKAIWKLVPTISSGGSSIGPRKEELVAVAISSMNRNRYCLNGHGERLKLIAPDVAELVATDWHQAELSASETALLRFCEKAVARDEPMVEDDIDALRQAGYTDEQVLEIVLMIALRQFCNTIGDTLGVEPYFEPEEEPSLAAS